MISPFKTFCNQFELEVETLLTGLERGADLIGGTVANIILAIAALTPEIPIPQDLLNDKLSQISGIFDGVMPDFSDFNKIQDILKSCNILQETLQIGSVSTILDGFLRDLNNDLNDVLAAAFGWLDFLEYPVAQLINLVEKMIDTFGITVSSERLRNVLQCLSAVCDRDVSSWLTRLNNILDGAYLTRGGKLDRARLYSEGGLSSQQIGNVEQCINRIEIDTSNAISNLGSTVTSFVDRARGLVTIG